MKTPSDRIEILKFSIDELRRMHDELCDSYTNAKTKILTFLAGEFAMLGYLYSDGKLFIPPQIYGVIFYFIGVAFALLALGILFTAVLPVTWQIAPDTKTYKKLDFKNYEDFLEDTKDKYIEAVTINRAHNNKKHALLNAAFYLIVISAILLLVIKKFQ